MLLMEKLKELRKAAGLTQAALADVSGVEVASIRCYEQGRRFPTFQQIARIAAALGVTVLAFVDCDDVLGAPLGRKRLRKAG